MRSRIHGFGGRRTRLTIMMLSLLLLGACQQQWPPPPPVPGQPLSYAQKHYQYLQEQQRLRDFRFR